MSDNPPAKKKVGRPPAFSQLVGEKIYELIKEGKTDREIAEILGVSRKTIFNWGYKHPEFLLTKRHLKHNVDNLVEAALFKKAVGCSVPETKIAVNPETGEVIEHEVEKHFPPDPKAAIFWLRNRRPKQWKEQIDLEHKGSITHAHVAITPEILKAALTQDAFIETEVTHVEPSSDRTGNNLITSTGNPRNPEEGPLD